MIVPVAGGSVQAESCYAAGYLAEEPGAMLALA